MLRQVGPSDLTSDSKQYFRLPFLFFFCSAGASWQEGPFGLMGPHPASVAQCHLS